MSKINIYLKSILIPVLLGGIVGLIISPFMNYDSFIKPPLAPPAILFPIVWTILYILMGISYGILEEKKLTDTKTHFIYYLQLIVNLLWPIFFFVLGWKLFAFIWILLLIILVILMIKVFYSKSKTAAFLQIPYLLWLLFAAYLNIAIYLLKS